MIYDPEIREAAECLAAEWARSIDTLPMAAEVHAIEFTLHRLIEPVPGLLDRLYALREADRPQEVSRATHELSEY